MINIQRVFFMIHPTCWAEFPDGPPESFVQNGGNLSDFYAASNWEKRVNQKQKEFISKMLEDDVLIIYPIGKSNEMRELISYAERILGTRCLVIKSDVYREPEQLEEMDDPIRHFLEDEDMEGRSEFWDILPVSEREDMIKEIREACEVSGYNWRPAALKVVQGNRLYAMEIKEEFRKRGFEVDPSTVESESFGEGFEQCAVDWKSMLSDYLGWTNPIENRFDLSVSGAPILFDADFRERLSLESDIRLFLWEKSQGRPMGLFVRARARLEDPSYFVHVPIEGVSLEGWNVTGHKVWPSENPSLAVQNGNLRVPVLSGTRKVSSELQTCYLIGCDTAYDRFRELLYTATIYSEV